MVGYSGSGYRVWDYDNDRIIIPRDVKFNEEMTHYDNIIENGSSSYKNQEVVLNEDEMKIMENKEEGNDSKEQHDKSNWRQRTRFRKYKYKKSKEVNKPNYSNDYEVYSAYCLLSRNKSDPLNYEEAKEDEEWKVTLEKELNLYEKLKACEEAELPYDEKAIQTKWVFRTKEDDTKKARLGAKGFQIKEEDPFQPTYSPVAKLQTVRLMISIALQENGWIYQQPF